MPIVVVFVCVQLSLVGTKRWSNVLREENDWVDDDWLERNVLSSFDRDDQHWSRINDLGREPLAVLASRATWK